MPVPSATTGEPTFFYPTQADGDSEWVLSMLEDWKKSGKRFLCFPFQTFAPHTLPTGGSFWMYMYYRASPDQTTHKELRGKVKFCVHVILWGKSPLEAHDVYVNRFTGNEKVFFLCDKGEELVKTDGSLLDYDDFSHRDGLQLASTIRTSIAPVICNEKNLHAATLYP